jgi:hypothetical protein
LARRSAANGLGAACLRGPTHGEASFGGPHARRECATAVVTAPAMATVARLPPVSQWSRRREVFASSTSGEGVTYWA